MTKVNIVQIAVSANDTEIAERYLDDKGRVWYEVREYFKNGDGKSDYRWVWKQVDLPDEPEEIDVPF